MDRTTKVSLIELAQTQDQVAQTLCTDFCRGYHRSWAYLRSAGLVGGVEADYEQYAFFLKPILEDKKELNILIAGSADVGLLSLFEPIIGRRHKVTLIDKCATPLAMCERFLSNDLNLQTVQEDLLTYTPSEQFDLILCHSLIPFFSDEQRCRLLQNFSSWLSHDGAMILSLRLKHDSSVSDDKSEWIVQRSDFAVKNFSASFKQQYDETVNLTEDFKSFYTIMSKSNLPYSSEDEAREEFIKCGLSVKASLVGGNGKSFFCSNTSVQEQKVPGIVLFAKILR